MEYQRRWENRRAGSRRGRSVSDESRKSYYGVPVIHRPHWKWMIVFYFFLGGISGAAYVISTVAHLFGGAEGRRIARAGRYVSLAALIPSPILLILDLGRPERFHHMLRIYKFRSPMSVGTWGLLGFSVFSVLSAAIQAARDGLLGRRNPVARLLLALPERLIAVGGTGPAFFLSGYTGVLLAVTAVPVWTKNALLMGPLFMASALSSATAAIALILSLARGTSHAALRRLERLDVIALLAEVALLAIAHRRLGPTLGRPLNEGRLSRIYRFGVLGTGIGTPLALASRGTLFHRPPSRWLTALGSLLTLAGGFMFRYVMVMAGRASADDPEATFEFTKADDE